VDVAVVGCKGSVSEELRTLAQAKVAKLGRLAPVLERAEVRLTEDQEAPATSRAVCEVTMTGHGHTLRASATGPETAVAVDLVVGKLGHQIERLKGKLVGRTHSRRNGSGGGR
jgi:ribosomal subunit interface protein